MTYKKTLLTEISNHSIGNWNKITIEKLPIGVDVYVTFERVTDLRNAKHLTDILKVKNNGSYAQPRELFLHTKGTSTDSLILDLVAITSTNEDYFENIPKQELALKSEIETSLLTSLQFQMNSSKQAPLPAGGMFELDTSDINSIKFTANQIIHLEINENGALFPYEANKTNLEFTKDLESIKFYNNSDTDTNLVLLIDGILPKDKGVFDDDIYTAGVYKWII